MSLTELLTESEERVLDLLCEDLTNEEIGRRLFLTVNTVKTHVRSILRKLKKTSRNQAATWARANGYGQEKRDKNLPLSLPFNKLAGRRLDVVTLVAQNMTNKEIGEKLGISQHTVKTCLAQAAGILGESNRYAIARAYNACRAARASNPQS